MSTPAGFDSGGFLASNAEIDSDFTTVAVTLDNRPLFQMVGAWDATGTKASTATARGTDPKLILGDAPFSDFDMKVDVGYGDALYVRYVDANNWIRVSHYQTYSTSNYACNPYACNPVACNPYACNPVACNPYACNPYACNPYACNPVACNPYPCNPNYTCNPYSCNCVTNYQTVPYYFSGRNCYYNSTANSLAFSLRTCNGCNACCYDISTCPAGYYQINYTCARDPGATCTQYVSYTCQTCYQTCYSTCYDTCYSTCYNTCYSTCYDTCYSTCYNTCYSTCYQTCTNYYYDTYVRLEKFVGGVLTLVNEVNLGQSARCAYLRVVGKGSNIQVFSDRSPSAAHINQTVSEFTNSRRFGVGRHGYGNQDTGNTLDNLVLKNA